VYLVTVISTVNDEIGVSTVFEEPGSISSEHEDKRKTYTARPDLRAPVELTSSAVRFDIVAASCCCEAV